MLKKSMVVLGLAALLGACSHAPTSNVAVEPWNGGTWNSVLGYVGPANVMVIGGPSY